MRYRDALKNRRFLRFLALALEFHVLIMFLSFPQLFPRIVGAVSVPFLLSKAQMRWMEPFFRYRPVFLGPMTGRPVIVLLTNGQMSDHKGTAILFSSLPKAKELVTGKGHDSDWFCTAFQPGNHAMLSRPRLLQCAAPL